MTEHGSFRAAVLFLYMSLQFVMENGCIQVFIKRFSKRISRRILTLMNLTKERRWGL